MSFKSAYKAAKRHWEFVAEAIIVLAFLLLLVAERFGKTTVDSTAIGSTIVGLIFFASVRLVRQSEQMAAMNKTLGMVRQNQEIQEDIRQIPGSAIGTELDRLLAESDQWHIRGGSARWQLRRVMPHLAGRRDMPSRYVIQVIDPLDSHLCKRYGQYRANSRAEEDAPTLADGPIEVRRDLLACIYAAGWYQTNSQVRPEITLLRSFSPLRIDVGAPGLMVTIASKAAPALFAAKDTWYYRSVVDELEQLEKVSARLILPADERLYPKPMGKVTAEHVEQMLRQVTVDHPERPKHPFEVDDCDPPLNEIDFESIAERIRRSNP